MTNYIKNSRCVVLPSEWYENGPYSAMEAMALGKPLLVSNLGGLPELVEQGINGYIFNDKYELVKYINKMISMDSIEYRDMCEKALTTAKEYFDPIQYVKDIESYLK